MPDISAPRNTILMMKIVFEGAISTRSNNCVPGNTVFPMVARAVIFRESHQNEPYKTSKLAILMTCFTQGVFLEMYY